MKDYHITVGSYEDYTSLVERIESHESIVWPVPKKAKVGDTILFLIPAFVGDIMATGIVGKQPTRSERWPSKYAATIGDVRLRDNPIPIDLLRLRLPDWKYLSYARGYTTVPQEFVEPLRELLKVERRFDVETGMSPDEIGPPDVCIEGAVRKVTVNAYERNPVARRRCIEYYGATCFICGLDFRRVYGDVADGLIHVHHLRSISDVGEEYEVDPIHDLRPVCPNCHAVIHRRTPAYSVEEVKSFLKVKMDK